MTSQSGLSKMTADSSRRRMLKDNSWIKMDGEEEEPVDYDPNFGKSVLGRLKSSDDDDGTPVNSGTSVISLSKRYGGSQDMLDKSSITMTTKSSVTTPTSPSKPAVPAKSPALKTSPNTSAFTARVFSGSNTNNKTVNPVKRSFGEKTSEVTVSQTTNRLESPYSAAPSSLVTVSSSPVSSVTSSTFSIVKNSSGKSPIRTENVSFSYESPTSSVTTTKNIITNSNSLILEETRKTKPSEDFKLNDISYSSTHAPSSETLNTYSYSRSSAPLHDLADTLIPMRSGSVHSQPIQSQTHVMSYNQSYSTPSQTLYSPTKTAFSEFTPTRSVGSRDVCSICAKPITGTPRMILEDLNIFSHTSCFKCVVCQTGLGNLEAGKSLWVHRDRVNCFNCYSKMKGQWYM